MCYIIKPKIFIRLLPLMIVLSLCASFFIAGTGVIEAQSVGSVTVSGATVNVGTTGNTLTVSVTGYTAQLTGMQLIIDYDASQVDPTALNVPPGIIMAAGDPTTDPLNIALVSTSFPTGSFPVLTIDFDCIGAGTSSMDLQYAQLSPLSGSVITITDPDGRLLDGTINQTTAATPTPTPVPTPIPSGTTPTPEEPGEGGCFIATASSGDPDNDGSVLTLRGFRDEYLLSNGLGSEIVSTYYNVSPPVADFIADSPGLTPVVRGGLLPAVGVSTAATSITMLQKILIVSLLSILSIATVMWFRRRAHHSTV